MPQRCWENGRLRLRLRLRDRNWENALLYTLCSILVCCRGCAAKQTMTDSKLIASRVVRVLMIARECGASGEPVESRPDQSTNKQRRNQGKGASLYIRPIIWTKTASIVFYLFGCDASDACNACRPPWHTFVGLPSHTRFCLCRSLQCRHIAVWSHLKPSHIRSVRRRTGKNGP